MKKILIVVLFIISVYSTAKGQDDFYTGSVYSAFGIGDLSYSASIRTDMMGIQGISLTGNYINSLNPASNTDLRYTLVTVGARSSFLESKSSSSSKKYSDANVMGFNLGVPIWQKYGSVLLFGFNPYSNIQYKISGNADNNGISYTQTFAGLGGLTKLNFGIAAKPVKFLSVGGEFLFGFGNIKNLTFFDYKTSGITNYYERDENQLNGAGFKGGVIFRIGDLFKDNSPFSNFNIGFYYNSKMKLSSSYDKIYTTVIGNDTVTTSSNDVEIPESIGFGITKQIGKQIIVSSDIVLNNFSGFQRGGLLPAEYQNNFRYGVGLEVLPAIKKDKNFLESISYRLGFTYDNSYFKIAGESVNNYALNFGFGIPVNNENAIDLGFTLGMRGKTEGLLIKDNYLRISLGFNFGEFWFLKPANEDR